MTPVVKKQLPQKTTEFSDLSKFTENLSYQRVQEAILKISWSVKSVKFLWFSVVNSTRHRVL